MRSASAVAAPILLSVISAAGYTAAAVAQRRLAVRDPKFGGTSSLSYLRSTGWWGSAALNGLGAALHVLALRLGSLTMVQPFGILTLVFALPIDAAQQRQKVSSAQWQGVAAVIAGLITITLVADPKAPSTSPAAQVLLLTVLGGSGVIWLLTVPPQWPASNRGTRLAASSGIASALGSALTQALLIRIADGNSTPSWDVVVSGALAVAVVALSLAGMLLAQSAYSTGLPAPLAVLTIANPLTTTVLGMLVWSPYPPSYAELLAIAGAMLLASYGILRLTNSRHPTEALVTQAN